MSLTKNTKVNYVDSALFTSAPMDWSGIVGAMKPGAHLLLFNDVGNHHLGTIGAEDNGMEIRDTIAWVFADEGNDVGMRLVTVARKPLEGTVAENVLKWGTGGLNVDICRIGTGGDKGEWPITSRRGRITLNSANDGSLNSPVKTSQGEGRWPANLTHDNSPNIVAMFPDAKAGCGNGNASPGVPGSVTPLRRGTLIPRKDSGSAARFFYSAPCLNDLLGYLIKLVTPLGGTILTDCDTTTLPSNYTYVTKC